MAGAVQRNAHFAIVALVNGRHSAGVADALTNIVGWRRHNKLSAALHKTQTLLCQVNSF